MEQIRRIMRPTDVPDTGIRSVPPDACLDFFPDHNEIMF